jgi:hypothetical protein
MTQTTCFLVHDVRRLVKGFYKAVQNFTFINKCINSLNLNNLALVVEILLTVIKIYLHFITITKIDFNSYVCVNFGLR